MNYFLKKYKHILWFTALFFGISIYYNFDEVIQFSPRSIHQWRQTDSASTALNYYQDGLNFFKPRMHYVMGGEGFVTGPGESPIFFYLVALLYKLFGPYDGIFRLSSFLILLVGLYCLSKIVLEETNNLFISLVIPSILLGSPLIAFYSCNFTPNIPAQGIAMTGIWFFYLFYKENRLSFFYLSMFFCAIAGLIKISALMSFLVIMGLWIIELFNIKKLKKGEKLFKKNLKIGFAFLSVIAIIFCWKIYADQYNELHQTKYFLSKIRPIWSVENTVRELIWGKIMAKQLPYFYHPISFWIIMGAGVLILLTPRKHSPILYWSLLFFMLGSIGFFLIMFKQFELHDYYAIELMLLPFIILSIFVIYLKKNFPFILKKWWFQAFFVSFVFSNFYNTKSHLYLRYDPSSIFMSHFNPSFYKKDDLQLFIQNLGIEPTDKVISAPDLSPNNTLYYLNLRGWTEYFMGGPLNALVMHFFLASGANYLIINDAAYLELEDLKPFLDYPIGNFENSIFVFDIRPYKLGEIEIKREEREK